MNKSIEALRDFKHIINYSKEGTFIKLFVSASVDSKLVYKDQTDCIISYNAKDMDYQVKINWSVSDVLMHSLGLHWQYSTNFQNMELKNKSLIITGSNYEIIISQGE